MEKNQLFSKLNGLVHGGDYNPDQWLDRPDILEEDIRWAYFPGPHMSLWKGNSILSGWKI